MPASSDPDPKALAVAEVETGDPSAQGRRPRLASGLDPSTQERQSDAARVQAQVKHRDRTMRRADT